MPNLRVLPLSQSSRFATATGSATSMKRATLARRTLQFTSATAPTTATSTICFHRSFSLSAAQAFDTAPTANELSAHNTQSAVPKSPIYVAATRQHVGKTTTSLAIMSGLQKRFDKVGFIKPVGQVCLTVQDENGNNIEVDKDVVVVRSHFGLNHCAYQHMSPVRIPAGYTRDFIDGLITEESQQDDVMEAFAAINNASDVVLCEGTGHCAVGSIVGASNARVASWVGGKMVLVANGGLGSTFDELELNRILCLHHNVDIAGVIVNMVQNDKYEQTRYYIEKALHQNWGVPLLGCIPDRPFLGCPALVDLERLMGGSYLVATKECQKLKHYSVKDINLVATSLSCFLRNLRQNQDRSLYLCHSSRDDIMLGFLMEYRRLKALGKKWEAALVVCGTEEYPLCPQVLQMFETLEAPPMLVCREGTRLAMERIIKYTPKHNNQDTHRLEIAVNHYEPYIDFDLLLKRTGNVLTADSYDDVQETKTARAS